MTGYPESGTEFEAPVQFLSAGHYSWTAPTPPTGKKLSSVLIYTQSPGPGTPGGEWVNVAPGETLEIYVGGTPSGGAGGYNGGGAGADLGWPFIAGGMGATDIRRQPGGLDDRFIVRGGQGGRGLMTFPSGEIVAVARTGTQERGYRFADRGATGGSVPNAPDDTNVEEPRDPGAPGVGGDGPSYSGEDIENIAWPPDEHLGDDPIDGGPVPVHIARDWHAGGGGGGLQGGDSGNITYQNGADITPWAEPNGPGGGPIIHIPGADLGDPGYDTQLYGNPRDVRYPYTKDYFLGDDGLYHYTGDSVAVCRVIRSQSAGRAGTSTESGDTIIPPDMPPFGIDHGDRDDGYVVIYYAFLDNTRHWNLGAVVAAPITT